ncbi:hypothetical protein [Actinomadura sp. 3N407]|uniref:hypothetical protein n=1 Tax=Actinomadura sp. 3N407 TaxID=3457423 RepID=UPI003FCEE204
MTSTFWRGRARTRQRRDVPPGDLDRTRVRQALQDADPRAWELFLAQYERLTSEITFQIGRREAFAGHMFSLLGSCFTLTVAAVTAAKLTGTPLLGLYGGETAALLFPTLLAFLLAQREHADYRIGQAAAFVRDFAEPMLPDGLGWDSMRKQLWPDRPGRGQGPALRQPAGLQVRSIRLAVATLDGLALTVGTAAMAATTMTGPWWTWVMLLPGIGLLATAVHGTIRSMRMIRHTRVNGPIARSPRTEETRP